MCLEYGVFNFLKCGDLSWGLFSQLDMFLYENLVSVDYATPGNFLVICGMRCYMQTLLIYINLSTYIFTYIYLLYLLIYMTYMSPPSSDSSTPTLYPPSCLCICCLLVRASTLLYSFYFQEPSSFCSQEFECIDSDLVPPPSVEDAQVCVQLLSELVNLGCSMSLHKNAKQIKKPPTNQRHEFPNGT